MCSHMPHQERMLKALVLTCTAEYKIWVCVRLVPLCQPLALLSSKDDLDALAIDKHTNLPLAQEGIHRPQLIVAYANVQLRRHIA